MGFAGFKAGEIAGACDNSGAAEGLDSDDTAAGKAVAEVAAGGSAWFAPVEAGRCASKRQ